MPHIQRPIFATVLAGLVTLVVLGGCADTQRLLQDLPLTSEPTATLSEARIAAALRQALELGSGRATAAVGRLNGYYHNPDVKILLPAAWQRAERTLREVGLGHQVDAFQLSMNRAAERAAPHAKVIFLDAVKTMTIADAERILRGGDRAATTYFRNKTYARLYAAFRPAVHSAMGEVGVTHDYQRLQAGVGRLPFTSGLNIDLDDYVTRHALDGLFYMLGREEERIRRDPVARTTELLREVFGRA